MSLIHKVKKPKEKTTIADLICKLGTYDLDSHIIWVQNNNSIPATLDLYACIENPNHPYYSPEHFDFQYEMTKILSIPITIPKIKK